MSGKNASYNKGARFENKMRDSFSKLGPCKRSFMSRGADLIWEFLFRRWSVSCKCKKNGYRSLYKELETYDILCLGADREIPIVAMLEPKFVELVGQTQAREME